MILKIFNIKAGIRETNPKKKRKLQLIPIVSGRGEDPDQVILATMDTDPTLVIS